MPITLTKGQRISLAKESGESLQRFCVGCNWGAIVVPGGFLGLGKKSIEVDLDLSCVLFDAAGQICDHIYSPLYKPEFLRANGLPPGKLQTMDGALHHTGDDRAGDSGGDDGLDNEIITVDLTSLRPNVSKMVFFLNNCGKGDFSQIPYAAIRMFEGSPTTIKQVFASYNVASRPEYQGKTAVIMGELYKKNGTWKFNALGDAFSHAHIAESIHHIIANYSH
jgi:tellurium resistance protein TerZ